MATPLPNVVDYTSKDFEGFQQSLFAYASLVMPQWTAREAGDFGVLMTDMVAYVGDILSYYQDRIANESFLATASQRASVINLAALIGYVPSPAIAATGTVTLVSDPAVPSATVLPAGTALITGYQPAIDGPVTFELDSDTTVPASGGSVTATVTQGADQGNYTLSVSIGVPATTSYSVVDLGSSNGIAGQSFTLPTSPLLPDTLTLIVQLPAGPTVWNPVDSLLQAGPTDQVYALGSDAGGASLLEFGDGVNGAIPPSGVVISASYKSGGGAYGNLAAGSITDLAHAVPGITVASSSATTGGADPESLASVRINAPRAWRTQRRCVTLQDYADAALSVPAVSKASALMSGPGAVTIYILAAQRAAPTSALITAAQNAVAPRAMAGMSVAVQSGTVVGVNLGSAASPVQLVVQPTYARAVTLGAVTAALQDLFSPDNTDFGMLMPLSAVYAAIDAVPGVALVNVPIYARTDLPQSGVFDAFFRAWECPAAGTFTINATGGI